MFASANVSAATPGGVQSRTKQTQPTYSHWFAFRWGGAHGQGQALPHPWGSALEGGRSFGADRQKEEGEESACRDKNIW